jgi:hypothetical protein
VKALRHLSVPLAVVAVLGAVGGFLVARQFGQPAGTKLTRVSVVGLQASPTPTPSPVAEPEATSSHIRIHVGGGSGGGSSGGDGGHCPAGCSCDQQPGGIIIQCR